MYVTAACRSVLLVKLRQSSKLTLQGLIVAKVQSVLLASCRHCIWLPNYINTDQCVLARHYGGKVNNGKLLKAASSLCCKVSRIIKFVPWE